MNFSETNLFVRGDDKSNVTILVMSMKFTNIREFQFVCGVMVKSNWFTITAMAFVFQNIGKRIYFLIQMEKRVL